MIVAAFADDVLVGNGRRPVPCWMANQFEISARSPRGNATAGVPYSVAAIFSQALALPILPVTLVTLALNSHSAGPVLSSRVIDDHG